MKYGKSGLHLLLLPRVEQTSELFVRVLRNGGRVLRIPSISGTSCRLCLPLRVCCFTGDWPSANRFHISARVTESATSRARNWLRALDFNAGYRSARAVLGCQLNIVSETNDYNYTGVPSFGVWACVLLYIREGVRGKRER